MIFYDIKFFGWIFAVKYLFFIIDCCSKEQTIFLAIVRMPDKNRIDLSFQTKKYLYAENEDAFPNIVVWGYDSCGWHCSHKVTASTVTVFKELILQDIKKYCVPCSFKGKAAIRSSTIMLFGRVFSKSFFYWKFEMHI